MKKFIFGTLMLVFITFACFAAKPVVSYKGCQKLAKKHNMTVITETDNCFYAECESLSSEQKFYVLYYICKPYTDGDIKMYCYYIDGEFYCNIFFYPQVRGTKKYKIGLEYEQPVLKDSAGDSVYLNTYGQKLYKALLYYHRADLLINLNKDLGIFIPDDKMKKYKLNDVDKLKYELDVIAGRIKSDE